MNLDSALAPAKGEAADFRVDYDASLVEEAVLSSEGRMAPAERSLFRLERDQIYLVREADQRDARFEELHGRWFLRLGLDRPLHQALRERPELRRRACECRVLRTSSAKKEMADLLVAEPGEPAGAILVRLRPESLLDGDALLRLLREELSYVADMLDPEFGYERELPLVEAGPAQQNLFRERYRAVWAATIAGRLARRGLLGAERRAQRLAEFARSFPELGEAAPQAFERWFEDARPSHRAIASFVLGGPRRAVASGHCPLCRFPTPELATSASPLSAGALRELRADQPGWRPEHGLCPQCADLYETRAAAVS